MVFAILQIVQNSGPHEIALLQQVQSAADANSVRFGSLGALCGCGVDVCQSFAPAVERLALFYVGASRRRKRSSDPYTLEAPMLLRHMWPVAPRAHSHGAHSV